MGIALSSRARRLAGVARSQPVWTALAVLLVLGIALRAYFFLEWRPGITGYSDSGIYFQDGVEGAFTDPFRTVGYGMFLIALHAVTPHLLLVTLVQHTIGLASAVVLFLAVRRLEAPGWVALVPAAVISLNGTQLFLEHSALSESPFGLLLAVALYCAVRTPASELWWAAAAGLAIGLAVWLREAGVILIAVIPGWLLLSGRRPTRATAFRAGVATLTALVLVGAYMVWRDAETGQGGLTTNGNWNLYGRVAPFADCGRFDPPPGTAELCDPVVPSLRSDPTWVYYIFNPNSPAQRAFGPPYLVSPNPKAPEKLRDFSIAAIEGQPFDYLDGVWNDLVRVVVPGHRSAGQLSGDQLVAFLLYGPDFRSGRNDFVSYWQHRFYPGDGTHRGDMGPLKEYERQTRFEGAPMVILLLLAAAAPWAVEGRARAGARLFALVGFVLLLAPILGKGYDFRFVVPSVAPLSAAAGLGAWGVVHRVRARTARSSTAAA